ncbi:hypothetical protein, partial [Acidipropionibacterium jensenii]|uniref:hypothetical protein n=1 Tax=Acidipropionibacterium jensenii TaxID=1749 RepID=UPI00264974AC
HYPIGQSFRFLLDHPQTSLEGSGSRSMADPAALAESHESSIIVIWMTRILLSGIVRLASCQDVRMSAALASAEMSGWR